MDLTIPDQVVVILDLIASEWDFWRNGQKQLVVWERRPPPNINGIFWGPGPETTTRTTSTAPSTTTSSTISSSKPTTPHTTQVFFIWHIVDQLRRRKTEQFNSLCTGDKSLLDNSGRRGWRGVRWYRHYWGEHLLTVVKQSSSPSSSPLSAQHSNILISFYLSSKQWSYDWHSDNLDFTRQRKTGHGMGLLLSLHRHTSWSVNQFLNNFESLNHRHPSSYIILKFCWLTISNLLIIKDVSEVKMVTNI